MRSMLVERPLNRRPSSSVRPSCVEVVTDFPKHSGSNQHETATGRDGFAGRIQPVDATH